MLNIFRSSKAIPENGVVALPETKRPDGEAGIIYDLAKELRSRDLTACSPEELETMKQTYADRLVVFRKAEDKKFLDNLFSPLHQNQVTESSPVPTSSPKGSPCLLDVPFRPRAEVRQAIKELADSMEFN